MRVSFVLLCGCTSKSGDKIQIKQKRVLTVLTEKDSGVAFNVRESKIYAIYQMTIDTHFTAPPFYWPLNG